MPQVILRDASSKKPDRVVKKDWGVICIFAEGKESIPWDRIESVSERYEASDAEHDDAEVIK